ncbi:tripartite motif-containing protein 3-like [Anneissia japonica]|uniref:tripartite motif-containing protein 3-like n=1 Tax=Anneissia japonica TaxID=1529436 RepID=UPI001425ABBA|nr:tripartite motif-containing protein 3-like [Anneissia japonica]
MSDNNTMAALQSTEDPTCSKCSVNSGCGLNFKCMHSICLECLRNLSVDDESIDCSVCQVDASSKQLSAEHSVLDASSVADHVVVDEDFVVKLTTKSHFGSTEYCEDFKVTCKLTLPSSDPEVEKYLSVEDHENGTYSLSGCCDVLGEWELSCYFNGVPIRQSPLKVNVVKGGLQDYPNLFRERKNVLYMFDIVGDTIYACGGANEITKFTLKGKLVGSIYGPASCQFTSLCCANVEGVFSIVCYNAHAKNLMIYKKETWHEWQDVKIESVLGKLTSHGDKVYVPDYTMNCVLCFSIEGDLLEKIEGTHYKTVNITCPVGIAITQKEDMLVLSYNDSQVVEFDNEDRKAEIWFRNTTENLLYYPSAIAIDERGQVIIGSQKKLLLFSKEGKFIKHIENIQQHLPQNPYCIFSKNRRIWVADKSDSSLRIYNY